MISNFNTAILQMEFSLNHQVMQTLGCTKAQSFGLIGTKVFHDRLVGFDWGQWRISRDLNRKDG